MRGAISPLPHIFVDSNVTEGKGKGKVVPVIFFN
jgi:hypothetical protein